MVTQSACESLSDEELVSRLTQRGMAHRTAVEWVEGRDSWTIMREIGRILDSDN
jgi:hypothetical protein